MTSVRKMDRAMKQQLQALSAAHPVLALAILAVGVPASMVTGVAVFTTVVTFPLALAFGWL